MVDEMEWTEEKSRRLWDHYAKTLQPEEYYSNHTGPHALRVLSRWVNFKKGNTLDFGCGPGYLIGHLLKLSQGKVFGLDFSEDSVAKANHQFERHPRFGGATAIQALPSPLPAAGFDTVVCFEVVEHLLDADLQATLKEIHRLLKPGGRLALTTPNEENLENLKLLCPNCDARFHRWQHVRSWSKDLLKIWLQENGFTPIEIKSVYFQSRKRSLITPVKDLVKRVLGKTNLSPRPHLFAVAEKRA